MPLDTEIKGEPGSVRGTAEWLRARSRDAHDTATQVYGARGMSEATWEGPAGEGFRSVMTQAGQRIDVEVGDLNETAGALDRHADDLHTVISRMRQAREIATGGGLRVHGYVIQEPGPAPPDPAPLPSDASTRQMQIHDSATQAQSAHATKVKAYVEASKVVTDASTKLSHSQSLLLKFLKGYAEKLPFNITDISAGLAGAVAARTSSYRAAARAMDPGIERAARYAKSWKVSPFAQARADALEIERRVAKQAKLDKAVATRTAQMVDKLPDRVKLELQRTVGGTLVKDADSIASPLLRNGARVLGKVPVVGLGITAAGVGFDISQGKDPGKAIASGTSSFVAGALATAGVAAAGGPVGWGVAAGALVGAGVGFVVDEWGDEIASGVGDAADAVGDFFGEMF